MAKLQDPLSLISSSSTLYVLHLSSSKAEVYSVQSKGVTLINLPNGLQQPQDLIHLTSRSPKTPWVILVDQSEETFWGGVMPILRGAAKTVWIDRMAQQSNSNSPYRWSELQGKSSSQPDKLRILGYTLERAEGITPWLDALKDADTKIRGIYSPVMLTIAALKPLKVKLPRGNDEVAVLVTPHAEGLRQTVLVGKRVRFSRLALHPLTANEKWFETVHTETARLREYLIGSGLLKNYRSGMHLYVTPPTNFNGTPTAFSTTQHEKDRYKWLNSPLATLVYVAALAKRQPFKQLAPLSYIKFDLSARLSLAVYVLTGAMSAFAFLYLGMMGYQLWQQQSVIDTAHAAANTAARQYQDIAKNYPPTPLTATQLVEMNKRWEALGTNTPPNMHDLLVIAGQTLATQPNMIIEDMQWSADIPPKTTAPSLTPNLPLPASKDKKDIATLVLSGHIKGVASDDLRGTRDALSKLEVDFNRNTNIRAELTKKPLDLSTKSSLTGSGKQESSELSFEIKLWQH